MKNLFKSILFIAAAAMTFSACNRTEIENPQNEEDFYYTFALTSPETRSILSSDENGKFGAWEQGDRLGTIVGSADPGYSNITLGTPVTFSIYKQGGLVEGESIYAYYPYNSATESTNAISFQIPASQSQKGEAFDFDAMPMVAEKFVVPAEMASTTSTTPVGEINLFNLGSVVDFQVFSSNATYAEETVLSVKFDASAPIAGSFTKNITSVVANDESTLSISGFTGQDVTTTLENAPAMGSERANATHVYMVVAPATSVTGSVIVTTNKAVYTYTLSTAQTFKRAGLKSFGLNLGTCQNREAQETAIPVTVSKTISEILYEMGKSDVTTGTAVKPLIVDDVVTMTTTGGGNSAKVYGTYPNQDWRIYQQNGGNVIISVSKGYELQSVKLTYSKQNGASFSGPDSGVAASVSGSSVTYTVDDGGHIRITAVEVKYVASSSTAYDFETIAALNQLATSTSTDFSGKLTNAVVSFVPGDNDAIIKDATGSILLHKTAHGLLQGQTFSGDLNVTLELYNSCSELTECDARFAGEEAVVAPASLTLANLVGKLSTYQNAYVRVTGIEVTAVSNKNVTVTDGTNNYVVYTSYANATCVVGDILAVEGTVAHYGSNDQIKVWAADDIEVTGHNTPSYTITITSPMETGCSIAASVDGSSISSGAVVEAGKTVNLTATVGSGYIFNGWTVTGATVVNASSTTTSFVVGSSNVSISASFSGANTDVLNQALTGVSGNNYTDWQDLQSNTNAVYAGQSAGNNSSIQLRSTNPSGIVTTASGGYAKKITVTWESHTASGRTLNVYGKSSAYESSADLYGDAAGVLLGTIVNGTSTEFAIPYDCQYIGLRSKDGAMYLSEIRIEWSQSASGNPLPTPTYSVNIASNIVNGSVTADKTEGIKAGESVTLTVSANTNYELQTLKVDGTEVTSSVGTDGKYIFTMPAHDVSVTAQFKSTSTTGGTVEFVPSNFSSQGTSGTGSAISATSSGITFACDKGYGTTQIRCYSGGKITISAETGKTITAINFTFSGSYTGGLETSYTNLNTSSWEVSLGSQARITAVSVTYN